MVEIEQIIDKANLADSDVIIFQIDSDDIIRHILIGPKQAIKQDKLVDSLDIDAVIGTSIFDYIHGLSTKMFYRAIFKLCRSKKVKISREYRCDSFYKRRFMQVFFEPKDDGKIELIHQTLREEDFVNPVITHDIHSLEQVDPEEFQAKRCSVCNKLELRESPGRWLLPEEMAKQKAWDLIVLHAMCPDCSGSI